MSRRGGGCDGRGAVQPLGPLGAGDACSQPTAVPAGVRRFAA